MVWIYEALEIMNVEGARTGRFRVCKTSDEDGGGPYGLCDCKDGHESRDAARACPIAKAKLEAAFTTQPTSRAEINDILTPWVGQPFKDIIDNFEKMRGLAHRFVTERDEAQGKLTALEVAVRNLSETLVKVEKERDEARKQSEAECQYGYLRQDELDALKAELTALRVAPGMAEVDAAVEKVYERIVEYNVEADCENDLGELADLTRQAIASRQKLIEGLLAVESLIVESKGVAGLHLNDDLAEWDELRSGGRFEEWLYEFDDALEIARKG